jgi:hypothetical protein
MNRVEYEGQYELRLLNYYEPRKAKITRLTPAKHAYLRFDVLTTVKMSIVVLWVVTPCGLAGGFRGILVITYKITWRHNPQDHNRQNLHSFPRFFFTSKPGFSCYCKSVASTSDA